MKRTYEFNEGEIDLHGENIQTAQSLKINTIHLKNQDSIESQIKKFIKM